MCLYIILYVYVCGHLYICFKEFVFWIHISFVKNSLCISIPGSWRSELNFYKYIRNYGFFVEGFYSWLCLSFCFVFGSYPVMCRAYSGASLRNFSSWSVFRGQLWNAWTCIWVDCVKVEHSITVLSLQPSLLRLTPGFKLWNHSWEAWRNNIGCQNLNSDWHLLG